MKIKCLPVYIGFVWFLLPLRENLILLFIGSTAFTTLLELATGFVLDKAFHSQWWDYSKKPFQLHGYICLQFSICWGIAGTVIIAMIHEVIFFLIELLPYYTGHILLALIMAAFVLGYYITIRTVFKLTKRVRALDDVSAVLQLISDEIGENLFKNVETVSDMASSASAILELTAEDTKQKSERKRELYHMRADAIYTWAGFHKDEMETLRKSSRYAFSNRRIGESRLLKAFPGVRFFNHNETLQKYKSYLLNHKERKDSG